MSCPCTLCCGSSFLPGSPRHPTSSSMGMRYTLRSARDSRGLTVLPRPEFCKGIFLGFLYSAVSSPFDSSKHLKPGVRTHNCDCLRRNSTVANKSVHDWTAYTIRCADHWWEKPTARKIINSTVSPYFHFGMNRQGLAAARPTCPPYVDGRKRENISF